MASANSTGSTSGRNLSQSAENLNSAGARYLPAGTSTVQRRDWTDVTCYRGPIADLVVLGVLREEQIPSGSSLTLYRGERVRKGVSNIPHDEHYISVRRLSKTRADVTIGVPLQEQEQREQAKQARKEAERQEQAKTARGFIEEGLRNPEACRKHAMALLGRLSWFLLEHTDGETARDNGCDDAKRTYGCLFDADEVDEALEQLRDLERWLASASLKRTAGKPQTSSQERRLHEARSDRDFQAFLSGQCLRG